MSLTTRILPADEWSKLTGTELETVYPFCRPESTTVIAVETPEGQIVGCWALMQVFHAEGIWIAPDYRQRVSVGRHLWRAMKAHLRGLGAKAVITAAVNDGVRAMIRSAGGTDMP